MSDHANHPAGSDSQCLECQPIPWSTPESPHSREPDGSHNPLLCGCIDPSHPTVADSPIHPDAGNIDANHYDRFTSREADSLLSDEGLAETHAKFTEALTDPFVHDAAKIVLELVEELQRLRAALRFEARSPGGR